MIVCHCHALTDRDIRSAIQSGAASPWDVADACGAGTGCGGCFELVEAIVEQELAGSTVRHLRVLAAASTAA
jgi:bacterioferritin-associated ferredoxin